MIKFESFDKNSKKIYKGGSRKIAELDEEKKHARSEEEKQTIDAEIYKTLLMEQ